MRDMVERGRGRKACKEEQGSAKLTMAIVQEMRQSYIKRHKEYGQAALARRYGVGSSTVWQVINNITWKV